MTARRAAMAMMVLAAIALAGRLRAEEINSGPITRIGGHFEVNVITGELKGQTSVCYVCKFAGEQTPATVLIFTRKADAELARLVRAIDAAQKERPKLGTFLVGIGGVGANELRKFHETHKLTTPLTVATEKEGPSRYNLNKDAAVTVVVYRLGGQVEQSYGFTDTRSAAAKSGEIAAAVKKAMMRAR